MPTSPSTRLLLVTSNPRVEASVREAVEQARMHAEVEVCQRRDDLPGALERFCPSLLLLTESGLPGSSVERLIETYAQNRPYLILGDQPQEASRLHLLRHWGPEYIPLAESYRLPLAVEHLLRESEATRSEERLHSEMTRAANAMGQSQKLATIGRLAGSIAHEINNPLESITNLLYLISGEPGLPPQAKQYLEMAQTELDRVVEISKQTLTFSRETTAPVPVHIPDLLEEVLTLYRRRILEKQIQVVRQFRDGDGMRVFPGEIRQVFSNLISNALEAMEPRGTLRLRVRRSTRRVGENVGGIRISIADDGMGMDPETVRRLGEPFFTTKGQRGTGLGLWVTRSIVRRYRGLLHLRSRTGRFHGTVFSIFFPTDEGRVAEFPPIVERSVLQTGTAGRSGVLEEPSASGPPERLQAVRWRA